MLKTLKISSFWFLGAVVFFTTLAWFLKSHLLMSLTGLSLFIVVMFPVVLSDDIKRFVKSVFKNTVFNDELISTYHTSQVIKFLKEYPVIFRAVLQTIGFWIVELYSDFNTFRFESLQSLNPKSLLLSVLLIIIGFLGQFYERDNFHKRLEWTANVTGNISFYRGLLLLISGVSFPSYWEVADSLFSDPFWFMNNSIRHLIIRRIDLLPAIILGIIFIFLIKNARDDIKNSQISNEKRELAWGLIFVSIWVLTISLFYFVIFILIIYDFI